VCERERVWVRERHGVVWGGTVLARVDGHYGDSVKECERV